MQPNDPLKNIRDYNLPNGYVYAGLDEGRAARGFLVELFKFAVTMVKLVRHIFRSR